MGLAGLAGLLVAQLARRQFLDPDVYHEMALARLALAQGWLPMREMFAYTPTITPSVHHEWGTGLILLLVTKKFGAMGLVVLKYALVALVSLVCLWCGRRKGASWAVSLFMAPIGILLCAVGVATVRAQVFTLLILALMMAFLDMDRQGRRWWIPLWLVIFTLWVNIHGGFVVGVILMGAHWIEQVARKRDPQWHLVFTGVAMLGLVFVNPYGWHYPAFVWHSVGLDRPHITEWRPLWQAGESQFLVPLYVFSLLIIAYAGYRNGWRRLTGILIVMLCAYAALRHARHISIYGVVWFCTVPAWLQTTQLGETFDAFWRRRRWVIASVMLLIGGTCVALLPHSPLQMQIPVTLDDEERFKVAYPAGAVQYLRENKFKGNVMPPFTAGAYLSWELHPDVKVGMDGRYEVAYQSGVVEELIDMYRGQPGWKDTLARYPTDLLLTSRSRPLDKLMLDESGWKLVYRDDAFDMFAPPGAGAGARFELPVVDRSGQPLAGRFP